MKYILSRRPPRYHVQLLAWMLLSGTVPTTTLAQTPIPRVGDSCPTQTYRSGDYCIPYKSSSTDSQQTIIQRQGKDCPLGYFRSGDYCKQLSGSDREAIPREKGDSCPRGWWRSGEYCVK